MDDDPLLKFIGPLAGVVLAVLLSMVVAATVAGNMEGDYDTRAMIYTVAVVWVVVGAVVMFWLTRGAESAALSVGRVLLWTASIWLWPVFALLYRRRAKADPKPPR